MLTFLGRGSAFANEQNTAFFRCGDELILLDCAMSAFHKIRKTNLLAGVKKVTVLVTHTHSDHVGGIPMLIHYVCYLTDIPYVRVAAPDEIIKQYLQTLIGEMDGCDPTAYKLVLTGELHEEWFVQAVPTVHVGGKLEGHCYGYQLCIGGNNVVYTGDTATLENFLPLVTPGSCFYMEAAVNDAGVHISVCSVLDVITKLCGDGVHVYLMHLDNARKIAAMTRKTGAKLAPLLMKLAK